MPKVSIIIPVYNVEKYIARCLDSIINQDTDDYEVICIDDVSPDDTVKILKSYESKYPDLIRVFVNEKNMGPRLTRNRGLKHAKGEYILFIDSDDYISGDYVSSYLKVAEKTNKDIVIGGYTRDVSGKKIRKSAPKGDWGLTTYPISCAKLFKKRILMENDIDYADIRMGEDILFSLCMYYANPSYTTIDYYGYHYYYNEKSITGSMNYEKNHERIMSKVFDQFFNIRDISILSEQKKAVIEYTYMANMVDAMLTYNRGCKPGIMKEKYDFLLKDMEGKFPNYQNNPYLSIFKKTGQTTKIKLGVGVFFYLHKIGLDKLLLWIVSLL